MRKPPPPLLTLQLRLVGPVVSGVFFCNGGQHCERCWLSCQPSGLPRVPQAFCSTRATTERLLTRQTLERTESPAKEPSRWSSSREASPCGPQTRLSQLVRFVRQFGAMAVLRTKWSMTLFDPAISGAGCCAARQRAADLKTPRQRSVWGQRHPRCRHGAQRPPPS